jgi:P-type Cu+ transporter
MDLNDAGALTQSDVGISVTDNISNFTPASDAIADAGILNRLPVFLNMQEIVLT